MQNLQKKSAGNIERKLFCATAKHSSHIKANKLWAFLHCDHREHLSANGMVPIWNSSCSSNKSQSWSFISTSILKAQRSSQVKFSSFKTPVGLSLIEVGSTCATHEVEFIQERNMMEINDTRIYQRQWRRSNIYSIKEKKTLWSFSEKSWPIFSVKCVLYMNAWLHTLKKGIKLSIMRQFHADFHLHFQLNSKQY